MVAEHPAPCGRGQTVHDPWALCACSGAQTGGACANRCAVRATGSCRRPCARRSGVKLKGQPEMATGRWSQILTLGVRERTGCRLSRAACREGPRSSVHSATGHASTSCRATPKTPPRNRFLLTPDRAAPDSQPVGRLRPPTSSLREEQPDNGTHPNPRPDGDIEALRDAQAPTARRPPFCGHTPAGTRSMAGSIKRPARAARRIVGDVLQSEIAEKGRPVQSR